MGMKLLPKSEIDKMKAVERKREIDEGLKLAKRVDNLREVAAAEEASLRKFRNETVKVIYDEITKEEQKLNALKGEIVRAQKEREELKKPLDAEWARVEKAKAAINLREISVTEREKGVSANERALKDTREEARVLLGQAKIKNELARTRLHSADNDAKEAKVTLNNARDIEKKARAFEASVSDSLLHRTKEVADRESSAKLEQVRLANWQKQLADEWKLLEDRKKAFERRIKRQQQ